MISRWFQLLVCSTQPQLAAGALPMTSPSPCNFFFSTSFFSLISISAPFFIFVDYYPFAVIISAAETAKWITGEIELHTYG